MLGNRSSYHAFKRQTQTVSSSTDYTHLFLRLRVICTPTLEFECHLLVTNGLYSLKTSNHIPHQAVIQCWVTLYVTAGRRIWSTPKDILCHNLFSHSQQTRISQLVWGCSCPVHFRMFLGIPLASTHIKWQYLLLPSHQKHLQILSNVPWGAQSCLVENHCVSITPPKICRKGIFQSKRKEFLSP